MSKKDFIAKIISEVGMKRSLPDDCVLSPTAIRKRVEKKRCVVINKNGSGQVSPLLEIEPKFGKIII